MPRRPLFCHACSDLLNQLSAAAEVVAVSDSSMNADARTRYFELRAQVQQHREMAHARAVQFPPMSTVRMEMFGAKGSSIARNRSTAASHDV